LGYGALSQSGPPDQSEQLSIALEERIHFFKRLFSAQKVAQNHPDVGIQSGMGPQGFVFGQGPRVFGAWHKAIAHAVVGKDMCGMGGIQLYFLSQCSDCSVWSSALYALCIAPDVSQEFIPTDDLSGTFDQIGEQLIFLEGEPDDLDFSMDATAVQVDDATVKLYGPGAFGVCSQTHLPVP